VGWGVKLINYSLVTVLPVAISADLHMHFLPVAVLYVCYASRHDSATAVCLLCCSVIYCMSSEYIISVLFTSK